MSNPFPQPDPNSKVYPVKGTFCTTHAVQLNRIEEKVDKLHLVLSQLLVMLGEDNTDEAELPATTLDGTPAGAAREEGQSLG